MVSPFKFYTKLDLIKLLGIKAKNPLQLLEWIKKIPSASIYFHTHRALLNHHYLTAAPYNDFAYWINDILNIKYLGEILSSIDIVNYHDIEDLRAEFVRILTDYILEGRYFIDVLEGNEFHFMSCKTYVLPTQYVAHDLNEFLDILEKISINSLYFHMFEARLRLQKPTNDFSSWFEESLQKPELARLVSNLDPYSMSLEALRTRLTEVIKKHA